MLLFRFTSAHLQAYNTFLKTSRHIKSSGGCKTCSNSNPSSIALNKGFMACFDCGEVEELTEQSK